MTTKKRISLCLLGTAITTGFVQASPRVYFTGQAGDGEWNNAANWEKRVVPGNADRASIPSGLIKITNTVTVGYLQNGVKSKGVAEVIIDGGTLNAVGIIEYNSANHKARGSITVQNGGSASFNSRFIVGVKETAGGAVTLRDGTLCVANTYYHNKDYIGTEIIDTRTTLHPGGLLDVDDLVLTAGVMDLAGGTLIVRRNIINEVSQWIADGRMIAMGGAEDWKIEAVFDFATSSTSIIAVPTDPAKPKPKPLPAPKRAPAPTPPPAPKRQLPPDLEPFTVGRLKPAMPDPLRLTI